MEEFDASAKAPSVARSGTAGEEKASRPFIVGIGSSAGGLEALTALLPGLPKGIGLSFVVVQHMSPTHRSLMSQLLGRTTEMAVFDVSEGCIPQADSVYVTPPNFNVVMRSDGSLGLIEPPNEPVPKPSVNLFFSSLAEVVADRAIGVILSGTGSDGAIGLHAIKAAGGYSLAQEPATAKYDGMVRAAIEAGGVDWVLPPEAIGPEIARVVQRQQEADDRGIQAIQMPPATLQVLLHSLYGQTRIDFTGYKEATLLRRIERRMTSTGCLTLDQYVDLARDNAAEMQALAQDMLISVTSFFRDRVAFERLREEIVRMLENKPPGEDVRVWVAGCASGEEAYSLAIILFDALAGQKPARRVQIFGSDIDEAALARARRAVYPATLLTELAPTVLEKHFVRHADGYEVSKALRGMVMFARHNVVQDPPFVRLDLVSCRNLLIYLQNSLQERLIKTFHYALVPQGLLFLGRSESIHGSESHFESLDRNAHLFRRVSGVARVPTANPDRDQLADSRVRRNPVSLDDLVARAMATRFAPASVVVDADGEVRYLKGDLQGLMSLPDGRPVMQVMSLLRRELRPELARLIRLAREGAPARTKGASSKFDAEAQLGEPVLGRWRNNRAISVDSAVRMSVQKLLGASAAPLLLVCIEWRPLAELRAPALYDGDDVAGGGTTALEEELTATREHLYTVIEELETSNEESQSLNEEIQTANEELQSTNEELEASNEELQASNEELTTVNEELQVKSAQWQTLSAELEGIYSTVDFPLLAFDARLVLTRTNRAVQRQLGIDNTWLGRHLTAVPWPTGMPSLTADIEHVAASGRTAVRQLSDVGSRHWVMRLMPRTTADGATAGVLVQLEDNSELRTSQQAAMRSTAQLQQLVERSAQLVCICDAVGRLQVANPEFERCHGLPPGSALGKLVQEVLPEQRARAFREAQIEAIRLLSPLEREETLVVGEEPRSLLASYYPLLDADGAVSGVCYQALDITQRKKAEAALLAATGAQLAAEGMARTKSSFLANMSHEIRTPMNAVLGLSRMTLQDELPPTAREKLSKVYEAAQALTRILDDVLDFSKIEAGALKFERRPFSLRTVLSSTRSLFSANAQERSIALVVDKPLGVPMHLIGDAFRLSQVLNNLVSNAVKFTREGEVRIGVAPVDSTSSRAGWVDLRFSVRDTGQGIAPQEREALFQPYTQGESSVTRRFGGTGLGLAISRRLVEQMQGRIGVNSEQGRGSEFWFTCSLEVALDDAGQVTAETAMQEPTPVDLAQERSAVGSCDGLHVLLAEDNALNRMVAVSVLEAMGHRVTIAEDGAEAAAAVAEHAASHFDVVLMDLHMPGVDGLEATRRIRALSQGTNLPILALTAAAMPEDQEACLAAGMDGHVAKPLEPEVLKTALRRVLPSRAPVSLRAGSQPKATGEHGATASTWHLPDVPSFDLSALMARVQGNQDLVMQLLRLFVEKNRATALELEALVRERQMEKARFLTHTLMGAAASLGAMRVAKASKELNSALGDNTDSPEMLQTLKEALGESLKDAERVLASRPR